MFLLINGKNFPFCNQVEGQQSHSSKMANVRTLSTSLPANSYSKTVDEESECSAAVVNGYLFHVIAALALNYSLPYDC